MWEEILTNIGQCLLSIIAIIVAAKKNKNTTNEEEIVAEIEAEEEAKKQKRIAKRLKKNKITQISETLVENSVQTNNNNNTNIPQETVTTQNMTLKEKIEMYKEI